jgi:hypothetical protein
MREQKLGRLMSEIHSIEMGTAGAAEFEDWCKRRIELINESGLQLGREALRYRFDAARDSAIKHNPRIKDAIEEY